MEIVLAVILFFTLAVIASGILFWLIHSWYERKRKQVYVEAQEAARTKQSQAVKPRLPHDLQLQVNAFLAQMDADLEQSAATTARRRQE